MVNFINGIIGYHGSSTMHCIVSDACKLVKALEKKSRRAQPVENPFMLDSSAYELKRFDDPHFILCISMLRTTSFAKCERKMCRDDSEQP